MNVGKKIYILSQNRIGKVISVNTNFTSHGCCRLSNTTYNIQINNENIIQVDKHDFIVLDKFKNYILCLFYMIKTNLKK